jgi:RNA recognition motif-containing protein
MLGQKSLENFVAFLVNLKAWKFPFEINWTFKDYAFVHFTTREAAEKAYEATKDKLVLDDCRVEVTWSKPIDRQAHNERKQLAKALTSGNGNRGGLMGDHHGSIPLPVTANSMFPPQPLLTATMAAQMNRNFSVGNQSMMLQAPRLRDAPEFRGYSTPGTQGNLLKGIDEGFKQQFQQYLTTAILNHFVM